MHSHTHTVSLPCSLSLYLSLFLAHTQYLYLFLLAQSCRTVAFCSRFFMTLTIDLAGLCRRRGRRGGMGRGRGRRGGPPSCRIWRQQRRHAWHFAATATCCFAVCHLLHLPLATCLICAFECFVFTHAHDNAPAAPRWPWQERAKEILSEKHNALRTWKPFVKHATVAVAISRWCYLLLLQSTSLPARQNGANAPQPVAVAVSVPLGVQRALGILCIVLPATAPCGRVPPSWLCRCLRIRRARRQRLRSQLQSAKQLAPKPKPAKLARPLELEPQPEPAIHPTN